MIIPIVSIPASIANGLADYKDLFPRCETFQHIQEYCTGIVLLNRPSIQRMSQCFVDGPCQSSLNKAIGSSPWSGASVNQRRLELISHYHHNGFTVGIIDSSLFHHPRGQNIYTFTNMLVWNAHKILSVQMHRWDIEPSNSLEQKTVNYKQSKALESI